MKFKIYCTEMHDLSKNVNLSRVCGVNLAFYRESDTCTAGAKTSVSVSKS